MSSLHSLARCAIDGAGHALETKILEMLDKLLAHINGEGGELPFIVYGPFEAGVFKLNEKFRMRMVVKCRLNQMSRAIFSSVLGDFSKSARAVTLSIDLNPLTV